MSHLLDRPVTLGRTAHALPVDPEGLSSLLEVQQALQQLGFVACGVKFDRLADIAECTLPAILHVRERHFVVAMPAKDGRVVLLDPPRMPRLYRPHALRDQWQGVALLVSSSTEGMDRLLETLGLASAQPHGRR